MAPEELELLRSAVRGLLSGADDVVLRTLGDLDLLSLLVSETNGGAGWMPIEATVVADEIGRACGHLGADQPTASGRAPAWLATSVAAAALDRGGGPSSLLNSTVRGDGRVIATSGDIDVAGERANGILTGVELGPDTEALVAVGPGGDLHLVDIAQAGVRVRDDPASLDTTTHRLRVELTDVTVTALGRCVAVRDAGRLLAAATGLGALRAALERLVPYLSDRVAFEAPVASFQAIQHRLVDLALLESRLGTVIDAAARALASEDGTATRLVSAAHVLASWRLPGALDECIQLSGGIGFTWEYPLHHELRRSLAEGGSFGTERESAATLVEASTWG